MSSTRFRLGPPSSADLLFSIVALSKATVGAVRLAQSDGDLAAHLTVGERILSTGSLPTVSLGSYTAPADPFIVHAWLAEILFALLHRLGGLPMLAVFTAVAIGLTHALVIVFLRRRGVDPRWALLAGLVSLALSASHWLTRPHLFSILGAFLTLLLLESAPRHKRWLVAGLFAVWANLHGGWLFGLLLIGTYVAGELLQSWIGGGQPARDRARQHAVTLGVATLATLLNPYGPALHVEVIEAVTSPLLAQNIAEYLSPNFHELTMLPFLLAILTVVALLATASRPMPVPWLLVLLVSLFFALRSFRNIALFGVTAWPLVALHVARSWGDRNWNPPLFREFARIDARARAGPWSSVVLIALLLLGLNHGRVGGVTIIDDEFDRGRFPVTAVDRARDAGLGGRVFHPWVWGGYLLREWPEARLHVDPLEFNRTTIESYTTIDFLRPGWQDELRRWNVGVVLIRADAPLTTALRSERDWRVWYSDSTAVLFVPRGDSTETTRGGLP